MSTTDDDRWDLMFQTLLDFGKEHMNNYNVRLSYQCAVRGGQMVKLGQWLNTQRQLKRRGKLRADRQKQLQVTSTICNLTIDARF